VLRCVPSGREVRVAAGTTVLEAVVAGGLPLGQSCSGVAVCGACRVRVVAGAKHLSPVADDERKVLTSLGAGDDERLACRARVQGAVTVTTTYW
jgi:ferredoxin, 2Fe-2S